MGRAGSVIWCSLLALAACASAGGGARPPPTPGSPSAATTTPRVSFAPEGCPVDDEAFCARAAEAARALVAGDAAALLELSRPERFECTDVDVEFFPACETSSVLEGYPLTDARFAIEVLDRSAYRRQLDAILSSIEASYSDEQGDGSPTILGVGTCGPPDPERRSYHLVWTAAASEGGSEPERLLGSFEFTYDHDWAIALWFLDTVDGWGQVYTDPFAEIGCAGAADPWLR